MARPEKVRLGEILLQQGLLTEEQLKSALDDGRKPLLLIGSAGMAVTLATVAYAFSTAVTGADGAVSLPGNNGIIALVAANLYVIFFNMSWGPIMWVMLG